MADEVILSLFDLYWFKHAFFGGKPVSRINDSALVTVEEIREPENHFQSPIMEVIQVKSQSEYLLSSNFSISEISQSTNSISSNSKLQTILSGKEEIEFYESEKGEKTVEFQFPVKKKMEGNERKRRKRGSRSLSKSLSDLEFEELKGFMDLGFVFSEEDKNSNLVSIIPGLQKLGLKRGENEEEEEEEEEEKEKKKEEIENETVVISRPYLSEAWEILEQENEKRSLMNWRVPRLGTNEMDMKDHLKFWAHTVASTVR